MESSDALRQGETTALAEMQDIAGKTRNPVYMRLAQLARELSLGTRIRVMPAAEIAAFVRANAREGSLAREVADEISGLYVADVDTILLAREAVGTALGNRIIMHEAGHAISIHAINVVRSGGGSARTQQLVTRLEELFVEAQAKLPNNEQYWRRSLKEFIAEAWSNPTLQRQMLETAADSQARVAGGARTLWSMFVQALRNFFGVEAADVNLLEEVLYASENMATASRAYSTRGMGASTVEPITEAAAEEDAFTKMWRAQVELLRNADTPNPDNAQTQAEVDSIEAESEEMGRSRYYGAGVVNGVVDKLADVFPLDDGRYKVIIRPQAVNGRTQEQAEGAIVTQIFDSASEAIRYAADSGVRVQKTRAEVEAQPEGVMFADEYTKATPIIRNLAQAIRKIVALVAPAQADWVGSRMLAMLGYAYTGVASQRYFLVKADEAVQALTGVNPGMAQRFQSALREQSAVHQGGEIAQIANNIWRTLKETGLDPGRFSMYRVALHTPERNARKRGELIDLAEGREFDADTTGFKFNGLTGDAAAEAYLASLTEEERAVFGKLNEAWTQANDYVLQLQYQAGMLSRAAYVAMGGKINGERVGEGVWENYVPIKHHDSDLVGRRGAIGSGSSSQDIDHGKTIFVAFAELQSFAKAAMTSMLHRELAAFHKANPTALDAYVEAERAKPKKGRNGEDITWTDADLYEENSLVFYEDGKRRKIVYTDPNALQYIKSRQNRPGAAASTLGFATHVMAATRTTWSIPFIVQAAAAWDTTMTMLGFEYAANGTLTPQESIKVARMSLREFIPNFRNLIRNAATRQTDDPYLRLYAQRGGGVAPGARSGFNETSERLRRRMNPLAAGGFDPGLSGAGQRAFAAYKKAEDVMHTTEDLARFSAFKAYIKFKSGQQLGQDSVTFSDAELMAWAEANPVILESALEVSRRITGDFSDHGTSHWLRAMFMFFNPAVQGVRQLAGISGTTTGRAGLAFAAVAAAMLAAGHMGDEDDEDMDGGSRYLRRRDRGRSFLIGDEFAWPAAPEIRFAVSLGEAVTGMANGKLSVGDAAVRMAGAVVDTVVPLNIPEADAPIESYGFNLLPAAAQPLLTAFFGIDGLGNETEIDASMVRDAEGNRVAAPANYERARARDPAWVRQLTQTLFETTGIDFYPGRVNEVVRQLGGGALSSAQQATEEGPGTAITRSFRSRYNEYAIQEEFENTQARFEQQLRVSMRNRDGLSTSPKRARAILELRRTAEQIRELKISGYSRADIYRNIDAAKQQGNTEAARGWMNVLGVYNQVRSAMQAEALRRAESLEE